MKNYFGSDSEIYFEFPLDGDCLNKYDGTVNDDGSLTIVARVKASETSDLYINEVKAEYKDGSFECPVRLTGHRNTVSAIDRKSGLEAKVAVYKLKEPTEKYRVSVDDNILWLQDINDHKDSYKSIFENPYLKVFKKAHDLYGAVVHFNIYYEFDSEAMKDFSEKRDYFNLSMMTDKFKDEFRANSDWLRLSFHADKNYPDEPYKETTLERISEDIEKVHREIIRFAGEESLSKVTTLHWGASNIAGVRALRQHGYKGLAGYFEVTPAEKTLVAYHYPIDFVRHVGARDFWKDNDEDVIYGRIDIVLNCFHKDTVLDKLKEISKEKGRFGFLSMLIHEEYFYSDYRGYLPDFEDILLNACKFAVDTGHEGSTMASVMFD